MKKLVNEKANKKNLPDKSILEQRISFSFEFFKQIDYFGLGECDKNWYILLLKTLQALSCMTTKDLHDNGKKLHYHKIEWNQKNIPIQPEDITWVKETERENLWQIHITKSRGRIIGFMHNHIFYIVLLDPNHNMQPCKRNSYTIRETTIKTCASEDTYEELEVKYNELVSSIRQGKFDDLPYIVAAQSQGSRDVIYTVFDKKEDFQWCIDVTSGKSYNDIVTAYLISNG